MQSHRVPQPCCTHLRRGIACPGDVLPGVCAVYLPRTLAPQVLASLVGGLALGWAHPRYCTDALRATLVGSALLGTAYSAPPLRLKRFPLLAGLCIMGVRHAHMCTARVPHVYCMCTASALYLHCLRTAWALPGPHPNLHRCPLRCAAR